MIFKLPMILSIKGNKWRVKWFKLPGDKGLCDTESRTILIDESLKKDSKEFTITLLHEYGHAVWHELHLDQAVNHGVEEIAVEGMAQCLAKSFNIKPKD
jgi:Zn-dependent peptidase ImmA (M78 family)